MTAGSRHLARRCAVQALYQWDLTEQAPADIERHFISDHDFAGTDTEYFQHLVQNIPLYTQELISHLQPYLDRDFAAVDPVERAILRLGAFELEYEKDIPAKVVIDEAVELSKVFSAEHGYKYVNGVLDKLAQELRPT